MKLKNVSKKKIQRGAVVIYSRGGVIPLKERTVKGWEDSVRYGTQDIQKAIDEKHIQNYVKQKQAGIAAKTRAAHEQTRFRAALLLPEGRYIILRNAESCLQLSQKALTKWAQSLESLIELQKIALSSQHLTRAASKNMAVELIYLKRLLKDLRRWNRELSKSELRK